MGAELEVSCEAGGGGARPTPRLAWLLNGAAVEGGREEEVEGGLVRSYFTLPLDRSHLGTLVTCRWVLLSPANKC